MSSLFLVLLTLAACGGNNDTHGNGNTNSYTVTANTGAGGSISPASTSVAEGTTASFTVISDVGYSIASASGCGGSLSDNIYTTSSITADCSVNATFMLNNYTISTSTGNGGNLSPSIANVSHGDMTSFTVNLDSGYSIASIVGCGGSLSGNTYTTGAISANCTVTATFQDDTLPTVSIADGSIVEGDSGSVSLEFDVSLSKPSSGDIYVDYTSSDGTATAGSDYTATSGTLTIPAASTVSQITVTVNGDTEPEPSETINITLFNASANATLGTAAAVGTITNDDPQIAQAFCSTQDSNLFCRDMSTITNGSIPDSYSEDGLQFNIDKGICEKIGTGSYTNSQLADTGFIRMTLTDGYENNQAMSSSPTQFDEPGQFNVGFLIRISANSLQAHNPEEWKHSVIHLTNYSDMGGRPTLFMWPINDSRGEKATSLPNNNGDGSNYYWIPTMAQDANAVGSTDEAGNVGSEVPGWYSSGNVHGFTWNDYVDEWVYIELEFNKAPDTNNLYVYTPDGNFRGAAYPTNPEGTPLIQSTSLTTTAAHGHYRQFRYMEWVEFTAGADSNTTHDIDYVQVNNAFMGPPPGFID
jgi:hypothetical protein